MKLTIERAALLRSLAHVQNVVERRNTIPILSNVMLAAEGDRLGLTATDMDLSLVAHEPAQVSRARRHDGRRPHAVRHRPQAAGRQRGRHRAGRRRRRGRPSAPARSMFNLPTLPADEFPAIGEEQLGCRFDMPAADLARLIDKTRFAISTEETRYYLNGIYLHATKGGAASMLRGVATDGHRLARVEVALPDGRRADPGVIVPRKTVGELRKLIDDIGGEVEIGVSPTRIRFAFERAVLISKLIDGTFPDYERVIPTGNDKMAIFRADELGRAVDRVATISTEKTRAVKLALRQRHRDRQRRQRRDRARDRGARRRL